MDAPPPVAPPRRGDRCQMLDLLFHRRLVQARRLAPPSESVFQHAVCMDVSLLLSADIDECADGFVECDSKSTCVNLPGWYHCECRDGYHDNGLFSTNGESCVGEWPQHQRQQETRVMIIFEELKSKFQTILQLCHCSGSCSFCPEMQLCV